MLYLLRSTILSFVDRIICETNSFTLYSQVNFAILQKSSDGCNIIQLGRFLMLFYFVISSLGMMMLFAQVSETIPIPISTTNRSHVNSPKNISYRIDS